MSFNTKIQTTSVLPSGSNIHFPPAVYVEEKVSAFEQKLFEKAKSLPRDQFLSYVSVIKALVADIQGNIQEMRWKGFSEDAILTKANASYTHLQAKGEQFLARTADYRNITSDSYFIAKDFNERLDGLKLDFRKFVNPPLAKAHTTMDLIKSAKNTQAKGREVVQKPNVQSAENPLFQFPPRDQLAKCLENKLQGPSVYLKEKGVIDATARAFAGSAWHPSSLDEGVTDVVVGELKGINTATAAVILIVADSLEKCAN